MRPTVAALPKLLALALALALALVLALPGAPALAAGKPAGKAATAAPKPAQRFARIGGGQIVPMAPSKLTNAELAALRPHYDALKPKLNNP